MKWTFYLIDERKITCCLKDIDTIEDVYYFFKQGRKKNGGFCSITNEDGSVLIFNVDHITLVEGKP